MSDDNKLSEFKKDNKTALRDKLKDASRKYSDIKIYPNARKK